MDNMYPESRQTSREQFGTIANSPSQFGPLPRSSHDGSTVTSPGVTDSTLLYPQTTEEWVDTGSPTLTLSWSAPLAQDYGTVTFPGSPTFYQTLDAPQAFQDHSIIASPDNNGSTFDCLTPGAPQVSPQPRYVPLEQRADCLSPTPSQPDLHAWLSQFDNTTPLATTTPGKLVQCPACQVIFPRWQEHDRHLLSHLPRWIHCPLQHCPWRGNRINSFKDHWQRQHRHEYDKSCGRIPGREEFEIFDPAEFVKQIKAGVPALVVALCALERVHEKADRLKKPSMSTNAWGSKSKRAPR